MRLRIPALAAALAGLISSPATAQRPGTLEFGGFGRFTRFDASLGLRDGFGAGGLLGGDRDRLGQGPRVPEPRPGQRDQDDHDQAGQLRP